MVNIELQEEGDEDDDFVHGLEERANQVVQQHQSRPPVSWHININRPSIPPVPPSSPPLPPPPSPPPRPPPEPDVVSFPRSQDESILPILRTKRRRQDYAIRKGKNMTEDRVMNSDDEEDEDDQKHHKRLEIRLKKQEERDEHEQEEKKEEERDIQRFRDRYTQEQIEEIRRYYWYDKDLKNRWCFKCRHERSKSVAERFKDFDQLQAFHDQNASSMNMNDLVTAVLDLYEVYFRHSLPERSIDPYTGKPIPAHWWWPEIIVEHYTKHHISPIVEQENLLRTFSKVHTVLQENICIENPITGKQQIDQTSFKQLMELTKVMPTLLNKITQTRQLIQKNATSSNQERGMIHR